MAKKNKKRRHSPNNLGGNNSNPNVVSNETKEENIPVTEDLQDQNNVTLETEKIPVPEVVDEVEKEELVENNSDDTIVFEDIEEETRTDPIQEVEETYQSNAKELSKTDEICETEEGEHHRHGEEHTIAPVEKKKNPNTRKYVIMGIGAFFISAFILFLVILVINRFNDKVYKNVFVLGNDVSGMTSEEVVQLLENVDNQIQDSRKIDVYQGNDSIYTVRSQDIDFSLDVEATAKRVMEFGRSKHFFTDNFRILQALIKKEQIEPVYQQNEEKLNDLVKNIDLTVKDRFVDESYSVDEKNNKLIITKGKSGNSIDYETEKQNIHTGLAEDKEAITLQIITKKPAALDLNEVHQKVKRDAKDAYIDKSVSPAKFVGEQVGYDFNVEELQATLNAPENTEEGKVIEYPLTVIQPKVKLADITYTLYKDKLAGYTTYFDTGSAARVNNLNIALKYLNGKIIMPGETFSFNNAIGNTTAAKGYQSAATFKGGTVVNEMGGGICQTTSTLYNVALMANLEIVERHPHGLPVGYVPPSRDATVYSPVLDFKFKNTRSYPVKIVTSFSFGGNLNISIYGTKEATEYEVILSSKTTGTVPFTTKYEYDNTLPQGQQVVKSAGVNGYTSIGYITKKLNGAVVSSEVLSKDTYNAQQQVVRVGTAQ